jgi:plasmid stabilization system protein ParE
VNFEWTERALRSLLTIEHYVSEVADEATGRRLTKRLFTKAKALADFPHLGRAVPQTIDPRLREVIEGSYRIIYQLDAIESPRRVSILGVVHGSQLLENTALSDLLDEDE